MRALDRYTLQFMIKEPRPRFLESLAGERPLRRRRARGHRVLRRPGRSASGGHRAVQAGPMAAQLVPRLRSEPRFPRDALRRASRRADDAEGQAILARFKGRRLPMVDRVEISIIEEEQPRWLAFVNGEADVAYRVGYQFAPQAMPNGKVAPQPCQARHPRLSDRRGSRAVLLLQHGGSGRRRLQRRRRWRCAGRSAWASTSRKIIAYAYNGLGTVSQGPTLPHTIAYDPTLKTECGDYDPARAQRPARPLRLSRQRRRRLARATGRLAAACCA